MSAERDPSHRTAVLACMVVAGTLAACVLGVCLAGVLVFYTARRGTARREAERARAAAKRDAERARAARLHEERAVAFAREIEEALAAGDGSFMDKRFDAAVLSQRMLGGRGLPPETLTANRRSLARAMAIGEGIAGAVKQGGSYKFLRFHRHGDQPRVLFRLLLPNGGANYHDMVLTSRGGKPLIADIHVSITGEFLSDSMRRSALPVLVRQQRSVLSKLLRSESEYVKNIHTVDAIVKERDPDRVLALYRRLPPTVQRDKNVTVFRLKAAVAKGGDSPEYVKVLADFKAFFPGDPCLDFVLVDHYMLQEEYAKSRACVDRMQNAIGEDAHLHFLRGGLYHLEQKDELAIAEYEKAIALEPDLSAPYDGLLTIALENSDWAAVSKRLAQFETNTGIRLDNLDALPEYAEYLKTEECKAWKASRR